MINCHNSIKSPIAQYPFLSQKQIITEAFLQMRLQKPRFHSVIAVLQSSEQMLLSTVQNKRPILTWDLLGMQPGWLKLEAIGILVTVFQNNTRGPRHIAYLRNQLKSINTFEQSYDYIITLIKREKTYDLLFENCMVLICKS